MPRLDNFFWGSATSAHQIEGGNKNDFSETGMDAGRACDGYNLYEKDFDIAKSLNQNAHRFSIEWSRIEPEEGKFNAKELEHYRNVILALKKRGLEPFATLWHFTNPIWFANLGGWENKKSAEYFRRFVEFVVNGLKDEVKFWITVNEPEIYARHAYLSGDWPPKRKGRLLEQVKVMGNLVSGHKAAYESIKTISPSAQVGLATNLAAPFGLQKYLINFHNFRNLNKIRNHQDFIGLNYYLKVGHGGDKVSDLGWKIYPKGIYEAIQSLKGYNKPIYITENGIADAADTKRADFIKDHIAWMKKALAEGANVRGYFYWSLIDNFEWHHGFGPRFGLVEVDYTTMERKIRSSAYQYAKICGEGL